MGLEATLAGARRRALEVRRYHPDLPCVGIESGLLRSQETTIDLAVIAVAIPDGRWYVATSSGIQLPEDSVAEAERRGFAGTTAGDIIAQTLGGDATDPHLKLTHGRVSRSETLAEGLRLAFAQIGAW